MGVGAGRRLRVCRPMGEEGQAAAPAILRAELAKPAGGGVARIGELALSPRRWRSFSVSNRASLR